MRTSLLTVAAVLLLGCGGPHDKASPAEPRAEVDIEEFLGLWHEVARLPLGFEHNCDATSFRYERGNQPDRLKVTAYC